MALGARGNRWLLFDIVADPGETHDLSASNPQELKRMLAARAAYQKRAGVQPWVDLLLEF